MCGVLAWSTAWAACCGRRVHNIHGSTLQAHKTASERRITRLTCQIRCSAKGQRPPNERQVRSRTMQDDITNRKRTKYVTLTRITHRHNITRHDNSQCGIALCRIVSESLQKHQYTTTCARLSRLLPSPINRAVFV